ncbi:hypothetical protein QMK19_03500 [Streptomyces sp. H10-C2]|uniref:hypothetical protein n=1 Tax=unclassified Streptomyces TaxID=2593676 RepID=UPI0024BA62C2|nr:MULTISPECIES: hypothetical protein [unclassified Streptomyces]MDJ0342252.1 hypothetical protein [Streptomyces sp. PH10-H1]MDJ0368766.1 hypothetical protein [Streptomyces sp. H10-C2]
MTAEPLDDDDFPWDAPIVVVRSEPEPVMLAEWARDTRLTFGARGLLAEALTRDVQWDVTPESLAERGGTEDVDVIRGYFAELEREGYIAPQS